MTERDLAAKLGLSVRSITYLRSDKVLDPKASTLARVFDLMAEAAPEKNTALPQRIAQASEKANSKRASQPQHNEATL
jgi:hypothetical protein